LDKDEIANFWELRPIRQRNHAWYTMKHQKCPPPKKADDVPQILKHRRTKMLTESEISALLEQKLQAKKQEMINAWMTFQRNPTAKTFKASEDIPDKLMGEVLDEVAKEVLASSAPTIKEDEPSKKNLGSQENER